MPQLLVVIDIQNDYFEGGAYPLVGSDAAALRAAAVLEHFRDRGWPVVHVQHVWDEPDAPFMRPGTAGVEIHDAVRPRTGEPVVTKSVPNALLVPELAERVTSPEVDGIVVVGMMTSTCVDSTVRAAADVGVAVRLVHDACAAPDLTHGDRTVPGDVVHAAFVAALGDGFAELCSSEELVRA